MAKKGSGEDDTPKKVTDIDAVESNTRQAVEDFVCQWQPWPRFDLGVETMDVGQLRNALGLRASIDWGDPWPVAEELLLRHGFRWHMLAGQRVMLMKERTDTVKDDGWNDGEEVED